MKKKILLIVLLALAIIFINSGLTVQNENYFSKSGTNHVIPAEGIIPERIEIEQGWDDQTRLNFWFTSQGSQLIPYRWFTWLEQADNTDLFRSADHMELMRYLPIESSALNPSGLPIGFTISKAKRGKDQWLGFTCAACHTNQLDYKDSKLLIEGAPTLANFVMFLDQLSAALNATSIDDAKFERFAKKVLDDGFNKKSAEKLREKLLEVTTHVSERIMVNKLPDHYPKDFTSYARLDAFGNIQNAGSAFALHDLSNKNPPNAPVSYPFLWGTHQSDVVQWNASAPNTPVIGPLVRNMGEVVGVFGNLDIGKASWIKRLFGKDHKYSSTTDFHGLGLLESWIKSLQSPVWPQDILPLIDTIKAEQGRGLFDAHCVSCHQVIPRDEEGLNYKAVKTPLSEVGTDKLAALNARKHKAATLILDGYRPEILLGQKFGDTTRALNIAIDGVVGLILKDPIKSLEAGLKSEFAHGPGSIKDHVLEHVKARVDLAGGLDLVTSTINPPNEAAELEGLVYKARPLNGIWATAPYMHNGSVPNLWELLQSPGDRVTKFWVGDREFDPVNVGYNTSSGLSEFRVLDSNGHIQPGNSNLGHDYGEDLTNDQKWALIEYMKTL